MQPADPDVTENEHPPEGLDCPEVDLIEFIGDVPPASYEIHDPAPDGHVDMVEDVAPEPGRFAVETATRRREVFRETLARRLLGLVTLEVGALMYGVAFGQLSVDDAERMSSLFVSPSFAVFAGAVGYFYGRGR